MILPAHFPYYDEIFQIPGLLAEPLLVFGFQDLWMPPEGLPAGSEWEGHADLNSYLHARGVGQVLTMDHFDPRADRLYDMNQPVPVNEYSAYATLIDIGCLEHVFDTRQCLENCLRMVRPGGHYVLHTPVKGYYGHGLHTFHPEGLLSALELNGFELVYVRYSSMYGQPVNSPEEQQDVLLWAVARKVAGFTLFTCPQQGRWSTRYHSLGPPRA